MSASPSPSSLFNVSVTPGKFWMNHRKILKRRRQKRGSHSLSEICITGEKRCVRGRLLAFQVEQRVRDILSCRWIRRIGPSSERRFLPTWRMFSSTVLSRWLRHRCGRGRTFIWTFRRPKWAHIYNLSFRFPAGRHSNILIITRIAEERVHVSIFRGDL